MKAKELIKVVNDYYLEEEDIGDVVAFATLLNNERFAMCGTCIKRKSDICPWPNSNNIAETPCLEYSAIKINK